MMRYLRHGGAAFIFAIATVLASHASAQPLLTDDNGRAMHFVNRVFRGAASPADVALQFVGSGNVTGTRGPWCADFASLALRKSGHRPLANRMASSALAYGPRTAQPRRGDLVVLNRGRHVGFFLGFAKGGIEIISGNWSHRVGVAVISRRSISAFVHV